MSLLWSQGKAAVTPDHIEHSELLPQHLNSFDGIISMIVVQMV